MTGYIYREFIIHFSDYAWTIHGIEDGIRLEAQTFESAYAAECHIDFNYRTLGEHTW